MERFTRRASLDFEHTMRFINNLLYWNGVPDATHLSLMTSQKTGAVFATVEFGDQDPKPLLEVMAEREYDFDGPIKSEQSLIWVLISGPSIINFQFNRKDEENAKSSA